VSTTSTTGSPGTGDNQRNFEDRIGFLRGRTVCHEAPGVSGGGERPSLLGRRSGLMKRRGSRSSGTTGIGGKRPRKGEPCWYCQTVGLVEQGQKVKCERTSAGSSVTTKPAPTWRIWVCSARSQRWWGRLRSRISSGGASSAAANGAPAAVAYTCIRVPRPCWRSNGSSRRCAEQSDPTSRSMTCCGGSIRRCGAGRAISGPGILGVLLLPQSLHVADGLALDPPQTPQVDLETAAPPLLWRRLVASHRGPPADRSGTDHHDPQPLPRFGHPLTLANHR
jgi:hypothetical protein